MFRSSNQRQFQKGLDTEQSRLNRRDSQLSLRRKAREEHLQKRMRTLTNRDAATTNGVKQPAPTLEQIPQYVASVMQVDSLERQFQGVQSLRMLLSQERNPPIERVCKCGVVPKIVSLLHNPDDEGHSNSSSSSSRQTGQSSMGNKEKTLRQKLQFEAAWVVTNIASITNTECCNMLVKWGTIPKLVEMARKTQNTDNQDQAIWGLGNIAGENREMIVLIIQTGFFDDLLQQMTTMDAKVLGNTAWVLSNIIRNSPKMSRDRLVKLIHIANQLLRTSNDQDVLTNMLWCLSYMSTDEETAAMMSQHGVISVVTRVLGQETQKYERTLNRMKAEQQQANYNGGSKRQANINMVVESQKTMSHQIYKPCLRFLGNILAGEDDSAQVVLDAGYLDLIEPFVNHFCNAQRKEVIWSISNILAGSHQQIEAVLSRDHIVESIIHAGKHGKQLIKREATWCIGNATVDAVSSQIKKLANFGAIEVLCNMLNPAYDLNDEHIKVIVEALDAFLKVYGKSGYNPYADQVEEFKGLDFLEDRQAENNICEDTFNAIVDLMKKYWSEGNDFGDDNEDDFVLKDQLAAAVDNNTNTFVFGCGTAEKNMSILGHNTVNQVNREASNVNMYAF